LAFKQRETLFSVPGLGMWMFHAGRRVGDLLALCS